MRRLPAAAIAVVDVEQAATVVLQTANAAIALEVGVDRADVAVDSEVHRIAREVLGVRRATDGSVLGHLADLAPTPFEAIDKLLADNGALCMCV